MGDFFGLFFFSLSYSFLKHHTRHLALAESTSVTAALAVVTGAGWPAWPPDCQDVERKSLLHILHGSVKEPTPSPLSWALSS